MEQIIFQPTPDKKGPIHDLYIKSKDVCVWTQHEEDVYKAGCNENFHYLDESVKFCPYCGKKIEVKNG